MTYLLDTHYLLWSIADSKKISLKIKALIADRSNKIMVSVISFWEISLKSSIRKLQITGFTPEELPEICSRIGFDILELSADDSCSYHRLAALHHKDPFDRMLIWQAIKNDFILLSSDNDIKKYKNSGLKLL